MESILEQLKRLTHTGQLSNEKRILDLLQQLRVDLNETNGDENRSKLTLDSFQVIQMVLETGTPNLRTESFRLLRNAVAFNPTNQNTVRDSTTLLQWAGQFLDRDDDDKPVESVKICLQFLCNCIVGNQRNAEIVASTAHYIPRYLSAKINEAGYLLNTLLILLPHFSNVVFTDPSSLFQVILDNLDIESNVILLETLSSNSDFLYSTYGQLTNPQQLSYIQFLSASDCSINLDFFSSLFKVKADSILKSNLDKLEYGFQEITALLSLISSSPQMSTLGEDKALVTTVIHLLRLTHQSSLFNPIEKLSKVTEEHKDHPAFLFKANLIRLLGNLAHNYRDNQNLIGESCLELILNCTKIDALNPFITQWSILAIRNLLHSNLKNQSMVANLKLESSIYSKILTEEFGISVQANVEDNTVKIVSNK